VVALCLPATAQTAGLMDAKRLSRMKEGAYLINVGRGSAVDAHALCRELQAGRLAGALIDVTDPEPLPSEHPLWGEPNAVITPHVAGIFDVPYTVQKLVEIAAENLRRFGADQPLINVVDPQTGYRRL
jgi:phosphoglycerate dehydrogenase-like enzyme